jgi:hypothetical protein
VVEPLRRAESEKDVWDKQRAGRAIRAWRHLYVAACSLETHGCDWPNSKIGRNLSCANVKAKAVCDRTGRRIREPRMHTNFNGIKQGQQLLTQAAGKH